GVSTKTLRYYEDIGMLPPPARQANRYRNYSPNTRTRVEFITRGRMAWPSLANLRVLLHLSDTGRALCSHLRDLLDAQLTALDAQTAALTELRATVAHAHQIATTGHPQDCDPNQICSYL